MHYFIRIKGELFQVWPLTHPDETHSSVKITVIATGRIMRVMKSELILDY